MPTAVRTLMAAGPAKRGKGPRYYASAVVNGAVDGHSWGAARGPVRGQAGETGGRRVTGVDACRGGGACVHLDTDEGGDRLTVRMAGSLAEGLAGTAPGQVVGIDMPLGLLDRGWRAADGEARRRLGVRRSSIFAIPPAAVWQQPDYRSELAVGRALAWPGFSVQAWGLRAKLLEAAEYRASGPQHLFEVHPELSFATMAGAPLAEPKSRPAGQALRRSVLAAAGLAVPDDPAWRHAPGGLMGAAAGGGAR